MPATVHPVRSNGHLNKITQIEKPVSENFTQYAPCSETGLDGPDQVLPADSETTTKRDACVRIPLASGGVNANAPMSVPGMLMKVAKTCPQHTALVSRAGPDGQKTFYTFEEYEAQVRIVAKAFLKLGLERHNGVCIIGFNSPEWVISEIAAIYAGGIAAGIYTTNSPEACQYCIEKSNANIVVVEDAKQLEKIMQIRNNVPNLRAIIQYEGLPKENDVLSWHDVMAIGERESDDKLNDVLSRIAANECCVLVYTSGTVGHPKGVMLSHDNVLQNARCFMNQYKHKYCKEAIVSFLPLSHVAAQQIDIFSAMTCAATVHFADKNALKGTLLQTLLEVRPTLVAAVPRVWEKIYERMHAVSANSGPIKTWIANWAKAQGLHYNMNKMNGTDYKHWGYIIAKWLVFNKVRAALGLDRCNLLVSMAAPLSSDVKKFFMSFDMVVLEVYGMSETSGGHTSSMNDKFGLESIGCTVEGFETKIDNINNDGEGEICMKGRHVLMGYLEEPEKTAEAKDEDGWLHSGDIGRIDEKGFIYITGRIKELIITAGGENIPPVHIEHMVLCELPALSNAFLVGDRRKYLTMLVTLKTDMDVNTGGPLDTLSADTLKWTKSIGSKAKTVTEVIQTQDEMIYKEIDAAIKRTNEKATSNAQKIQKFKILPHDFSIPTGELGPTLKIKRNVVLKMYHDLIEEMYK